MCMTLHDPNPGSFVPIETCNDGEAQDFEMTADGRILPLMAPELCLTLGATSVPGGGRLAAVGREAQNNDNIPADSPAHVRDLQRGRRERRRAPALAVGRHVRGAHTEPGRNDSNSTGFGATRTPLSQT